ncbi:MULTISPECIES: hypothetical protein [Bacillaceae]|uniref:Uncharacterized protein n=1 Tax=Evansella alkalicola TaxID=745819 RepID=A0ABS6JRL5_9BACI|nr:MULTISPECIES: hypothetical protein [Bacillaceae]MBU9721128.1 hypothetical protein [Bacillus alkalicola]
MVYRKLLTASLLILFLVLGSQSYGAYSEWNEYATFKITIEAEGIIYEWEYENPDSFEYEIENRIYRGIEAKESFEEILAILDLSKDTIVDEEISLLREKGLGDIERVEVRQRDRNLFLTTWLWSKE